MTQTIDPQRETVRTKRRGGRVAGSVNRPKTDGRFLIDEDAAGERIGLNSIGMKLLRESEDAIPSIRLGSGHYYRISDIEAFLAK